jgi:hypothetical protein
MVYSHCGQSFGTQEELDLHMQEAHPDEGMGAPVARTCSRVAGLAPSSGVEAARRTDREQRVTTGRLDLCRRYDPVSTGRRTMCHPSPIG